MSVVGVMVGCVWGMIAAHIGLSRDWPFWKAGLLTIAPWVVVVLLSLLTGCDSPRPPAAYNDPPAMCTNIPEGSGMRVCIVVLPNGMHCAYRAGNSSALSCAFPPVRQGPM